MYCYTQCPQPCSRPPLIHASTGDSWTLPGKSGSVSCGVTALFSWVLVHARFIWASLAEMGFDSKCGFAPFTIFQGLLLCPWAWGISSQPLQHHTATIQAVTVLLGFFWPWTWSISSWPLQWSAATTPDLDVGKAHSGEPPPKFLVELIHYYLSDLGLDCSLLRTFWQHY